MNKAAERQSCKCECMGHLIKLDGCRVNFGYAWICLSRLIYCISSSDLCTLLTSSEYNRLSSESRELLWSSCELAQIRCSKLIAMRSKVTILVMVSYGGRDYYEATFQANISLAIAVSIFQCVMSKV